MKTCEEVEAFGHFTPGERAPGTHWIGRWVGRSQSGRCGEEKNTVLCHKLFV
jgi:hypothetical protein